MNPVKEKVLSTPKGGGIPNIPEEEIAQMILSKFEVLKNQRANWEDLWERVTEYVLPNRSDITETHTPGARQDERITDYTAVRANERFASGLYGYMCRPDEQWFKLMSNVQEVINDEDSQRWFQAVEHIMMKNIYLSNFSLEIHEDFLDLGAVGTSCMYIEEGDEYPLRFKNFHITQYVIEESAHGMIDTVIVEFKYSCKQAIQAFGWENLPENIQKAWTEAKGGQSKQYFTFLHAVKPRLNIRKNALGKEAMPFMSVYIEKESKTIVKRGGYKTLPYVVARFIKDPNEIYGRSPAINSLGEIYMVNAMKNTIIKSARKTVSPPMAVAHNSVLNSPKFDAGRIVYVKGSVFQDKPVPLQVTGDIRIGLEMIQQEQNSIKEAFYTDMFDYLIGGKYMTATEVEARKQSKLFLFAPILARIQSEKLNRILQRVFDILMTNGFFPPLPDALKRNPQYDIQFTGRMALALQNIEVSATQLTLGMIQPLAQYDPTILDNFDWNAIARGTARSNGMPIAFVKTKEQVALEREARAAQQKQMMDMQMAQMGADTAEKLGKPIDDSSLMAQSMQEEE